MQGVGGDRSAVQGGCTAAAVPAFMAGQVAFGCTWQELLAWASLPESVVGPCVSHVQLVNQVKHRCCFMRLLQCTKTAASMHACMDFPPCQHIQGFM